MYLNKSVHEGIENLESELKKHEAFKDITIVYWKDGPGNSDALIILNIQKNSNLTKK